MNPELAESDAPRWGEDFRLKGLFLATTGNRMPLSRRIAPETVQEIRRASQCLPAAVEDFFDHINPDGSLPGHFPAAVRAIPKILFFMAWLVCVKLGKKWKEALKRIFDFNNQADLGRKESVAFFGVIFFLVLVESTSRAGAFFWLGLCLSNS